MWRSDTAKKGGIFLVDHSCFPSPSVSMDVLANHSIFQELQIVHDTGYFSAMPSLEENWQQVTSQLSILAGVHPSLQSFNHTVRSLADGFTRARDAGVNFSPNVRSSGRNEEMKCFISLIYLTIFREMAKWIRCERTPARNKAVKCDLGR